MITGFEKYTGDLTRYEQNVLLPAVISGMRSRVGGDNAISGKEAVKIMRSRGYKIDGARFRKILHVIRVSGAVKGIVGTSRGYFIARNADEWRDYLKSINERSRHVQALADALTSQYHDWKREDN